MDETKCTLTVYFDEPFWVGVYERSENSKLEAARIVFGSEPKDFEVYEYFLKNQSMLRFSPPVAQDVKAEKSTNPKRMQRAISKQLLSTGIGTKAQQALSAQREQSKVEQKVKSRQAIEEEKDRKYVLHEQKKKEKHRGR